MKDTYTNFKGGLVSGITFFLIGLVFLLNNLGVLDLSFIWPIIPLGIGLAMLIRYFLSNKK
jgi:hypothetical protein